MPVWYHVHMTLVPDCRSCQPGIMYICLPLIFLCCCHRCWQAGYYDQLVQSGKLSALETEVAVQSLGVQGLGLRSRFKGKEMQEQYRKATAFESLVSRCAKYIKHGFLL
jgi:hypothetical protein